MLRNGTHFSKGNSTALVSEFANIRLDGFSLLEKKMDTCPICLEEIKSTDNFLCMPICKHKIHTLCELKAAQYDARCPVCRTKDETLTTRQEDDVQIYSNLESLAQEEESEFARYKRKRARVIRKHSRLHKLKEKLNREKKSFVKTEKELERMWIQVQKDCWKNDSNIQRLKQERKKYQRKTNCLCKKLENEVANIVGPKPEHFFLNIHL